MPVINDAYNANPELMRAAIETLAEFGRAGPSAGPGPCSGTCSSSVDARRPSTATRAASSPTAGIDRLVAVGEHAAEAVAGGAEAGRPAPTLRFGPSPTRPPRRTVLAGLAPGDVVLVKASRGLALDTVAAAIAAADPAADQRPRREDRA